MREFLSKQITNNQNSMIMKIQTLKSICELATQSGIDHVEWKSLSDANFDMNLNSSYSCAMGESWKSHSAYLIQGENIISLEVGGTHSFADTSANYQESANYLKEQMYENRKNVDIFEDCALLISLSENDGEWNNCQTLHSVLVYHVPPKYCVPKNEFKVFDKHPFPRKRRN